MPKKKCEYHGIPKNAQTICVSSGDCTLRKHKSYPYATKSPTIQ